LEKHLAGRKVLRCQSTRGDIPAESFTGKRVERVFCKGKHIFLGFEGGLFLHNHLLMRGTWKKLEGQHIDHFLLRQLAVNFSKTARECSFFCFQQLSFI